MTETSISPGQDEEAAIVASQGTRTAGEGGALGKTGLAWAWFEWARNPDHHLCVRAIFRA